MTDTSIYTMLSHTTDMLAERFDLKTVPQQNRFGATSQHIQRVIPWNGTALNKTIETHMYTGARATSNLEADSGAFTSKPAVARIKIEESHLRRIGMPLRYTWITGELVDGSDDACYKLSTELKLQADLAAEEKRNQMLNGTSTLVKAAVAAKLNKVGGSYVANGTATDAFLGLSNGSLASFHEGQLLDIRNGSSTSTPRVTVQVNDVVHDIWWLGGNKGAGIVVTIHAGAANLDAVLVGDHIVDSGETDGGYYASFSSLCDLGATPPDYFGIDRKLKGNGYLRPYGRNYANNGVPVPLNIDAHFGAMADTLAYVVPQSRAIRGARGWKFSDALIAQCPPELVSEAIRQAGQDSQRFTKESPATLAEAERMKIVAVRGWDGVVIRTANLPPIALQSEPLAPSNTIRVWDPSAWEFIRLGSGKPTWLPNDAGGIWHNRRTPATGNLAMEFDAFGFINECVFCDLPRSVYTIQGVRPEDQ